MPTLKPSVFALVGGKKSGKTTAIEILTKELTDRGYRVAAVKHIPEPNFTIDTVGKDTWRYAQSGATTIIGISAEEIAAIEKIDTKVSLQDILRRCRSNDVVFLEGFKNLIAQDRRIQKIVIVKSVQEAVVAAKTFCPILVFVAPFSMEGFDIPVVDVSKSPKKIVDLIQQVVEKRAAT